MKGYQLEFFTEQNKRHRHAALHDWLVDAAREHGIRGATVFMGALGFGHHKRLHSARFFELADQPVEITMVATEEECERFFAFLESENVHLVYARWPVEFGEIGVPAN
ncbi:MAG TPA: DUF190 domain-containing protein [Burkholderiaceae bacterium]